MGLQKVIPFGEAGSLTVSEEAGVAKLIMAIKTSVGGGQAEGVVKAVASVEIDIQADQLAMLGLELIKAKLPDALKGLVDELEKVAIPALKNS